MDHPQRKHLKRIPVRLPLDQRVIYFVTACCEHRRRLFDPIRLGQIAFESLDALAGNLGWQIHYVCIMPDHVHLLISPLEDRDKRLSVFVQRWKASVTKRLKKCGIQGPFWQNEFFDHLLRREESLTDKWDYVRMNPVRAGLCPNPDEYPLSGTPDEIRKKLGKVVL
ncbi:MAG: transposase [Lentisphaerae bacterium]|nr:transposase [Lentisphaerota bacterium]